MASDSRSQYPYLSEGDLNEYKSNPEQLKSLNEFRKKDLEKKIANFSLSENKFNDEIPPHSTASNELRLVIIGKTGQGKSATANTILGKVRFKEDFTATSVTRESGCITEEVDGRKISVMDTPGLQDTHNSNTIILKELARMTKLFPDGVHAFVYVMNMADPRFTAEDKNVLDLIEKTFGGGFQSYCLLVFSHGDSELKDIDLETYKRKQMEIGQATSGHTTPQYFRKFQRGQDQKQDHKSLAILLNELSWKMLAIDNKTSIPFEKAYYRKQIVAMVDRMRSWNRPEIYTNDMFVEAQQEREAMRQKGLRKGWDPSIMSKVETILAANPSISRQDIQVEVSRQLEEENQDKVMELQRREKEFEKERIAEAKRLEEQKRVDEKKREAEEEERRKRYEKEDQERKDRLQKEERESHELRETKYKEWQLKQEEKELERQKRFQLEEMEIRRRVTEEQEKHAQRIQLQRDEWEKRKREEEEKFNLRQQHQQEMWEKQFREDQHKRQEQEEDKLKRREEEESRRLVQIEREKKERQEQLRREEIEFKQKLSKINKEDMEREMKRKEEEQDRQNSEREQFELRQTQARDEQLQEREEWEKQRQNQRERDELERRERREREEMDRDERWKRWDRELGEREQADKERRKRIEKEFDNTQKELNDMMDQKKQIEEIAKAEDSLLSKAVNGFASKAKNFTGWLASAFKQS